MTCEKCKENRMDVKDYNFPSPLGIYSLCTPCMRLVFEWINPIELDIAKKLKAFILES